MSTAAVAVLVAVIGCLGAIDARSTFSASAASSAAGVDGQAAGTSAAKRVVRTSVVRAGGKSYLRVRVTSGYGSTRRFAVKQRVCGKGACRTVTTTLSVQAGRTAWQERYLGTGTYRRSGAFSTSVTVPPVARSTPAARVTVTATPSVTPTVHTTVTVSTTVTTTATVTATATATATVTATVTVTATPTVTATVTATPTLPALPTGPLCGAPANAYGFTFCDTGSKVHQPADDACAVFPCIENFRDGTGYLVMCNDGMVSMSGGIQGVCSSHSGWQRDVYRNTV
ncbi:hypothetical protein ABZU75_06320 [Streptosporangium sp. NPDC005286]|uniref:hypothetical protein n=1 Tax=Streptosporangium sp. NPDC005286 TaxID=3154463 RepID=UPI0033AB6679